MKKLFLLSVGILASVSIFADVLLVEDFEYDDFSTPIVQLTDNWTNDYFDQGSWNVCYGATISNGLRFAGYAGCGIGNGLVIEGETGAYHPERTFPQQTSGTVYAAFMFQPTQFYKSGYFFSLRHEASDANFTQNGRVSLEVDEEYDAYWGLQFGKASETHIATEVADPNKVYLVVVKYEIVAGTNNDKVSLFVLDEFTATEPAKPLIGPITDPSKPDINPGVVLLRGESGNWIMFDGIRVATTWAEAVAPGTCPPEDDIPSALSTPSLLPQTQKILRNGQLLLIHQDKAYNIMGTEVAF